MKKDETGNWLVMSPQEFNKVIAAMEVSRKWRMTPKPKEDRKETLECPICKGKLYVSQSAFNGHTRGQCETEGCIGWIE